MLDGVKETYRLLRAGKMGDSDVWGRGVATGEFPVEVYMASYLRDE